MTVHVAMPGVWVFGLMKGAAAGLNHLWQQAWSYSPHLRVCQDLDLCNVKDKTCKPMHAL